MWSLAHGGRQEVFERQQERLDQREQPEGPADCFLAVSHDGSVIATANHAGTVRLWSANRGGRPVCVHDLDGRPIIALAASPTSFDACFRVVTTAGAVFEVGTTVESKRLLGTITGGDLDSQCGVDFLPGDLGMLVCRPNRPHGISTARYEGLPACVELGGVREARFSPTGLHVAAIGQQDNVVRLYSTGLGQLEEYVPLESLSTGVRANDDGRSFSVMMANHREVAIGRPEPATTSTTVVPSNNRRVIPQQPVETDQSALCLTCSKLKNSEGIPTVRARWTRKCDQCDRRDVVADDGRCAVDPERHTVQWVYECCDCGSTDKKKQLVMLKNAVPYHETTAEGGPLHCVTDGYDCSENLFIAARCGHVLCDRCLVRGYQMYLPAGLTEQETRVRAKQMLSDTETYFTPPCVVCACTGAVHRDTSGYFELQTLRQLPSTRFTVIKQMANIAFQFALADRETEEEPVENGDAAEERRRRRQQQLQTPTATLLQSGTSIAGQPVMSRNTVISA